MTWVIYWEKGSFQDSKNGFVSYDNKTGAYKDEYSPVCFRDATKYKKKSDAKRMKEWYQSRDGFGHFYILKVGK